MVAGEERVSAALDRRPAAGVGSVSSDPAATAPVAVAIRGVSRVFGTVTALDRVTLDIRRGEFFSLLGPSGCGKTTLLRIIGGFETPSTGELLVNGRDVIDEPPYRRRTNMVFQHGALFPHLTVAENIAFGLQMKRVPPAQIRTRVDGALDLVRLGGYGARQVDQLSGGQRQRIALARALVNEPEVLLLDEPLSALDLQLRLRMQDELRRIQRETGGTFVFVTHDQGEAITMSDRLAVMQGGRILQVGTPREVYERPAHLFVAEFMGHSNFLRGTLSQVSGTASTVVLETGGEVPAPVPPGFGHGDAVVIALRYERVELSPGAGPTRGLTGIVTEETYMGATVRRRVSVGADLTLVSETANTAPAPDLGIGCPVTVSWAENAPSVLKP